MNRQLVFAAITSVVILASQRAGAICNSAPVCWSDTGGTVASFTDEGFGNAVTGINQATSGGGNGLQGQAFTPGVSGVYGEADASSGGNGVAGRVNLNGTDGPGNGSAIYGDNNSTAAGAWAGYFNGSVDVTYALWVSGTCRFGGCTSDARLKRDVTDLPGTLSRLARLRPVTYHWIDPQRGTALQTGFVAQEVEKVFPEWVSTDDQGYKRVNRDDLPILSVRAIQELAAENEALRARVDRLEAAGKLSRRDGLGFGGLAGFGLVIGGAAFVGARKAKR